jgi:hypothetical protein
MLAILGLILCLTAFALCGLKGTDLFFEKINLARDSSRRH